MPSSSSSTPFLSTSVRPNKSPAVMRAYFIRGLLVFVTIGLLWLLFRWILSPDPSLCAKLKQKQVTRSSGGVKGRIAARITENILENKFGRKKSPRSSLLRSPH